MGEFPPQSDAAGAHAQGMHLKFRLWARVYDSVELLFPLLGVNAREETVRALPQGVCRIVDLCTGTAAVAVELAAAFPEAEVCGYDLSPEMLAVAHTKRERRNLANLALEEADVRRLPLPDGWAEAATISFALHEMSKEIRGPVLTEARRVLAPGGTLVAVDYDLGAGPVTDVLVRGFLALFEPAHARDVLGPGLAALLTQAGFTAPERHTFRGFQIVRARR